MGIGHWAMASTFKTILMNIPQRSVRAVVHCYAAWPVVARCQWVCWSNARESYGDRCAGAGCRIGSLPAGLLVGNYQHLCAMDIWPGYSRYRDGIQYSRDLGEPVVQTTAAITITSTYGVHKTVV